MALRANSASSVARTLQYSVTREAATGWVLARGRSGQEGIDGRRLIVVLVNRLRLAIFKSALVIDRAALLRSKS